MAEFVSTTTPTYSDPLRAHSIKALEQRHKEMLAQAAQAGAITPENTQTPIQGFGHLANQLGDSFQRSRVDQAAAAQRQALAQTMAGMDLNNPKPQELAVINSADPELARQMLTQLAESRRAQAQIAAQTRGQDLTREASREGHDVTRAANEATVGATLSGQSNQAAMETARLEAQEKAAAELARTQREAKIDEEQRIANRPASDAAKIMQDVQSGKLTKEQGQALVDKLSAPSATELTAGQALQNTNLETQSALSDLKEARDLLGPEGTGIRAGTGAGFAQGAAKWVGGPLGMSDPVLTQKTERYNQIMSAEAINAMAQKLKGASTDYEMKAFVAIMNDANAEPKTKMQALNNMIAKAEAHTALQADQMKRAKVSAPAGLGGGAAPAGAARSPEDTAALDWATKNPNDPRAAQIKQRLGAP